MQSLFLEKRDDETSFPQEGWVSVFVVPFYNFFSIL